MKIGSDVLLKIVDIVRQGLIGGMDISQELRDLDLVQDDSGKLVLSVQYKATHPDKVSEG